MSLAHNDVGGSTSRRHGHSRSHQPPADDLVPVAREVQDAQRIPQAREADDGYEEAAPHQPDRLHVTQIGASATPVRRDDCAAARNTRSIPSEPLERPCLHCKAPLTFADEPGDATCPASGVAQYVTAAGLQGRYPDRSPAYGYGRTRPRSE